MQKQPLFSRTPAAITSNTLLKKTFLWAGILFATVCAIGFIVKSIISSVPSVAEAIRNTGQFDASFFNDNASSSAKTLLVIFAIGGIAILVSSIMTFIWVFRINKASKTFIGVVYVLFAIGQGVGFGALFSAFKATELLGIFGIAGGIFLSMGGIGFMIKDGTKLMPFMIIGFVVSIGIGFISLICYFTGVYSDKLTLVFTIVTGLLTCLYTVFDIWYIRSSSQYAAMSSIDEETEFRFVAFMAFRLASDLISLIWTVARLWLRYNKN